ncbi:hypothetical protein M408DRAFT_326009 [Serendipita vermifera MAFF 305830]|uniref:Uncharacterized protein n=1 Tax=Serendipita vermifera MAFF 305830 TaxID=933852 RepID=A0A0C2X534_SERVB|nr:hypothetical protein M408DRAFT_326009 [Serendipita vermifera MAFF 305830]
MGRTKTKTKRVERSHNVPVKTNEPITKSGPSTSALYEKAQTLVEQCDYELAAKFLKRILDMESTHEQAQELLGVVLLELSDLSSAENLFQNLIKSGSSGSVVSSAHLHLAQLSTDPRASLDHYQKAVDILYNQLGNKEAPSIDATNAEDAQQRQTIAKALVAMTEIWLTDLCMEEEAETSCESLLNLALQADPRSSEVLQSMASVRMSQQRPDEARSYVEQAWGLWKDLPSGDASLPPIPTRLSLTRLFLELSMYKEAMIVLNGVIEVDDQEVEAWYLEGWCFLLTSEDAKTRGVDVEGLGWQELAQDARDCLDTCVSLFKNQQHPDDQMFAHAQELMVQLEAMGIHASPEEGDDEEWKDVEDSDDEDDEMKT